MPHEDIICVLYDTFDFIEAARRGGSSSSNGPAAGLVGGSNGSSSSQQQSSLGPATASHQQQQQQQQGCCIDAAGTAAVVAAEPLCRGRVLVHCSQGVSRSTTIAIAYLMWKTGGTYDEVYQAVRALRGITSPNVGFMCQLINWAVSGAVGFTVSVQAGGMGRAMLCCEVQELRQHP